MVRRILKLEAAGGPDDTHIPLIDMADYPDASEVEIRKALGLADVPIHFFDSATWPSDRNQRHKSYGLVLRSWKNLISEHEPQHHEKAVTDDLAERLEAARLRARPKDDTTPMWETG